jgi:hypothetical protein
MILITRIFTDKTGESQFEEIQVSLTGKGDIGSLSEAYPVENLAFRTTDGSYNYDFHVAPARQFIVLLDGEIEIVTSSGEKRNFRGGDVLLVEDITGKGHKTRQLNPGIRKSIFITLKPQEK